MVNKKSANKNVKRTEKCSKVDRGMELMEKETQRESEMIIDHLKSV